MARTQHGSMWLFKRLAQAALLGWLSLAPVLAQEAAPDGGPESVIEDLNAALLEVMTSADKLGYEGRYKQLAPVLEASYDFPFMTRVATGTTWNDMTPQQRDELVALFTEMSIASYAARFDGFGGESFEILGEAPGPRDAVVVQSRLVRPNDEPVGLNYVMRDQEGGWRIVDVLLDAKYSELARQKAEFAAVLRKGGVPDLKQILEKKIADLEAEAKS